MKYRPEIDGIRAVAVVLVLIYHAGFNIEGTALFKGGFLGVDVFFVISGFLITTIIQKKIEVGTFTFIDFYSRRARRILPTLFTVLLAVLPVAWIYMKPKAIIEFANSILASLFFSSNINFLFEDSYTAESSLLKPLLHTWSLSLEEQFYFFFPILLILIHKFFKTRLLTVLILGFVGSFVGAVYSSVHMPDTSFFMIHTRSWELLAGSILAVMSLSGVKPGGQSSYEKLMPALGLGAIVWSSFIFNDHIQHPSFLTALPVLGTCLIIFYAQKGEWVTELLSTKAFVGCGLISYSLYLWHAPLLVFDRIITGGDSQIRALVLLVVSVLLSVLTYYFVEQPFRTKEKVGTRAFVKVGVLVLAILIGFSVFVLVTRGYPARLGYLGSVLKKSMRSPLKQNFKNCSNRKVSKSCVFEQAENRGDVISIGDSHGAAIAKELLSMSEKQGFSFYEMTKSNCPYVPGIQVFAEGKLDKGCQVRQKEMRGFLLSHRPATVIYNAKMNMYWKGETLVSDQGGVLLTSQESGKEDVENVQTAIKKAVKELTDYGHKVVIIYPVPEPGFFVLDKIKKELFSLRTTEEQKNRMKNLDLSTPYETYVERSQITRETYDSLGQGESTLRVYPEEVLCSRKRNRCETHSEDAAYYYDDNHLSPVAAKLLVEKIEQAAF